jgi:hypothetical protein
MASSRVLFPVMFVQEMFCPVTWRFWAQLLTSENNVARRAESAVTGPRTGDSGGMQQAVGGHRHRLALGHGQPPLFWAVVVIVRRAATPRCPS